MRRNTFLIVVCSACFGMIYGQQSTPSLSSEHAPPNIQQLIAAYTRSIGILETGLKQNWSQDRYQIAFGAHSEKGYASDFSMPCREMLGPVVSSRTIWDERMPLNAEVRLALDRCRKKRDLIVEAAEAFKTNQNK